MGIPYTHHPMGIHKYQVHPLDAMTSVTKRALEDDMKTNLAGNESAVGDVLYTISKLRYKAKGDPASFRAFFNNRNVPLNTIGIDYKSSVPCTQCVYIV